MSRRLKDGRREALSGQARNAVIFLHGYGADGADLLGLADALGPHLKNYTRSSICWNRLDSA